MLRTKQRLLHDGEYAFPNALQIIGHSASLYKLTVSDCVRCAGECFINIAFLLMDHTSWEQLVKSASAYCLNGDNQSWQTTYEQALASGFVPYKFTSGQKNWNQ